MLGVDQGAETVDRGPQPQAKGGFAGVGERGDRSAAVAGRAKAVEPGGPPEVEAIWYDGLRRRPERCLERHRFAGCDLRARGWKRHAHAIGRLLRRQFSERDHPQRDPGPRLVAGLVELDPALHRDAAHLLGEHRRARHLGVELRRGKASGKRKRRAAHDEAKPGSSCRKVNPGRRHDESGGGEQARLFGEAEIDEDAAGEENGDPERQAVGLGFKGTGERGDKEHRAADAAPRPVAPTP